MKIAMAKDYRRLMVWLVMTACALVLSSTVFAQGARVCWINANSPDGDALDMRMADELVFRSLEPGRMTAWVDAGEGTAKFEVRKARARLDGDFTTLPLAEGMRTLLVTVPLVGEKYRISGIQLEGSRELDGIEVFNALPKRLVKLPEASKDFALRSGGRRLVPEVPKSLKLTIAEPGEGIASGEISFSVKSGELGGGRWLLVILPGEEGVVTGLWVGPNGLILSPGEKFEREGISVQVPKLKYVAKELPEGVDGSIRKGGFDPRSVDWRTVESKFAWINAIPSERPVSLSVNGFIAIRRLSHGVPSGFVPWPQGEWEGSARMAGKSIAMASAEFALSKKGSALLVSSPKGKTGSVLIAAPGLDAKKAPMLRLVNALPVSEMTVSAESVAGDVVFSRALKNGEIGEALQLFVDKAGAEKDSASKRVARVTLKIEAREAAKAATVSIPVATLSKLGGDWVVVLLLDDESRAALEVFYCRMDDGAIYIASDLAKAPVIGL